MAGAKSYVVTSRKRLDAFLTAGDNLSRIELRVGQITGKPRYPKGWVGRKSRIRGGPAAYRKKNVSPQEMRRKAMIRDMRRQMMGMDEDHRKEAIKAIRAQFKEDKISSRGLVRKSGGGSAELGEKEGTQVAKVAGVLHAGSSYHLKALNVFNETELPKRTEEMGRAMHRGLPVTEMVRGIGKEARDRVKLQISREGHVDSGRLLKTTQYQLADTLGKQIAAQERAAKRAARKPRRRRA